MKKSLIALVTVLHLVPHPFGVSPIGATALYSGAYANPRIAWLVPLIPLFFGGAIAGFYDVTVMLFVYAGFALSTIVGRLLLSKRRNLGRYSAAVATGAFVFFLVSNFAIWFVGMYPPTVAGLVSCYVNGLPYLATAVAADAVYCGLLFGLHALIDRHAPAPVPA